MATSQKQIDANRKNAQSSTGPTTPEGLLNSKFNALKHGLAAASPCLPHESAVEYEESRAQLYSQLEPVGKLEQMLVDQIARAHWKMLRSERVEVRMFDLEIKNLKHKHGQPKTPDDDGAINCIFRSGSDKKFANHYRYQTQAENSFYKAMNALHKAQFQRLRKEKDIKKISKIHQDTIAVPSTEPPPARHVNGFVPRLSVVAQQPDFTPRT